MSEPSRQADRWGQSHESREGKGSEKDRKGKRETGGNKEKWVGKQSFNIPPTHGSGSDDISHYEVSGRSLVELLVS